MEIKFTLDRGAYEPKKAHDTDAGFDLRTPISFFVDEKGSAIIDTGVHMQIPSGYCGLLVSKSGLNVKNGLTARGLIDAGYTGSIMVRIDAAAESKMRIFERGDKITQIIILPVPDVQLVQVDKLEETERANGGFGSTGR